MTLNVYVTLILDDEGNPRVGVLLAKDQPEALGKAVDQCKRDFPKGKVSFVKFLASADLRLMLRSKAYRLLSEYDQIIFAATELESTP